MDATTSTHEFPPPGFLALAGHPLRWRLLRELSRSDRRVGELCELVGRPQSLLSYHLGRLRAERLVSKRRSSADRRDAYYRVDLARCAELLAATGEALHPALRLGSTSPRTTERRSRRPRARMLFLCTGNSARSQMAEALAEQLSGGAAKRSAPAATRSRCTRRRCASCASAASS